MGATASGIALLALALVGFAPASAAPAKAEAKAVNCTYSVETHATHCFDTFAEALAQASGGTVTGAPSDVRKAVSDPKVTAAVNSPSASVVIGVEYYYTGYGTPSLTFYGSHTCTGPTTDVDFYSAPLPTVGGINWNDNIESFIGYNNCWQKMFYWSNCTGPTYGYAAYASDLGSMNDNTECIYWS